MSQVNHIRETRARLGEHPGDDPLARLRHTVKAYDQTDPESFAVHATNGIYDEGPTGLTFGDLAKLEEAIRDDVVETLRRSGHLRS